MKVNQLKGGVILTYMSSLLSILISFIYTPVMLKILGQGEYGVYTLVNSVVANLGILSFGFSSSYIRFYSRYKVENNYKEIARLNGMFLTVFTVISIIALLCGNILVLNIENLFGNGLTTAEMKIATKLMRILVINIAISFPASVFTSFITANEKYVFLKTVNMIKTVFSPLLNLPLLLLGFGSVGMVTVTICVNLFADLINIYFCIKKLRMHICFRKMDFKLFKEVWVFSSFIFLNIITDQINWNVDKFVLGMYKNSAAVAVYGIAAQLNNYYMSISHSISSVFIPRVNRLAVEKQGTELTQLFTRVGRIQFIVLSFVLCIYIFGGQYFIRTWAGTEYIDSYVVGLILLVSVTIDCIQTVGIEIQRAKNLHKFRSLVLFFIACFNVALSIPLSKMHGPVGAAIGTAISLLVGNGILMNIYYYKKVGLDIKYYWKNILSLLPGLVIPVIYGLAIKCFFSTQEFNLFAVEMIGMAVLFCISMWHFGMNDTEKNLIRLPLRKVIAKLKEGEVE